MLLLKNVYLNGAQKDVLIKENLINKISDEIKIDDVEVIEDTDETKTVIEEYFTDAFVSVVNISDNKVVYHLSVDFSMTTEGSMGEGLNYSGGSSVKGDLLFGYEVKYVEDNPYTSAFFQAINFTLSEHMSFPEAVKEKMSIPEAISFSNVNFYGYVTESADGTLAYLDLSDHSIQDYAKLVIESNGYAAFADGILNAVLGDKIEGTEYRPGLVKVDVSKLIKDIDDLDDSAEHEALPEDLVKQPLSYYLSMGRMGVAEIEETVAGLAESVLTVVTPQVGVKYAEKEHPEDPAEMSELVSTSFVLNVSSAEVAANFGVSEEQLPIHGVAGLLVTVGDETGAELYALQELKLQANLSGDFEEFKFSFNGLFHLEASYNDQAELVVPLNDELLQFNDITTVIFAYYQLIMNSTAAAE